VARKKKRSKQPVDPPPSAAGEPNLIRAVVGFFVKLMVIYALLAVHWPGVTRFYQDAYRGLANSAFGTFGAAHVRFVPAEPDAAMDTTIELSRGGAFGTTPHNSWLTGVLPTAEVLALILATPIGWPRKRRALLWGLAGVALFVYLRLLVLLLHFFSGEGPLQLYSPGEFWNSVLRLLFEAGVVSPSMTFMVPIFIWVAATLRRQDLKLFDKLFATPGRA